VRTREFRLPGRNTSDARERRWTAPGSTVNAG
jgi:hypothetical protein